MTTINELYSHLKTLNKQWFYEKSEVDELLEDKLDEVDVPSNVSDLVNDTGFITNNDIVDKVNRNELASIATTGDYSDLVNVPDVFTPDTHEHSSSEVKDSNAHSNLGTSANATQSAINVAIDNKIGALLSVELLQVVGELPTSSEDTLNKLYLVAEETTEENDAYEIYVTVESEDDTDPQNVVYNYDWEKVDSARLDLSGYSPIDHIHGNISNDGRIGSTANQFVYTSTNGLISSKNTIGNINTDGAIGNDTGKVVTTTTNGVLTTSDWITEIDNVIVALIEANSEQNPEP